MSSTKKTSSTQTTTPNAPSFVAPQLQTLATNTTNLANANPSSYVAGADPLQTQAATGAAALGGNTAGYGTANNTLTGQANSGSDPYAVATVHPNSILPNLDAYMSPYMNNVVNSSLADYDFGAGQTQAQNKLALANDGTFGGSSGAIQTSMSNDAINRGRGTLASGLLNTGYTNAQTAANEDADRRQQAQLANAAAYNNASQFGLTNAQGAANSLVSANTAQNTDARSNVATQGDMGSILQQIAQAQAQAPLSVQQAINGAYGQLAPTTSLLTGQTQTGKSTQSTGGLGSVLGSLGSVAMGLGSLGLAPFTGGASLAGLAAV